MLSMMKTPPLDGTCRFAFRTEKPIHDQLEQSLSDHSRNGLKFRDRELSMEAVLNALSLLWLEMEPEKQQELLEKSIPWIESLIMERVDKSKASITKIGGDIPGAPPAPETAKRRK